MTQRLPHNCAAMNCRKEIPARYLMCRDHWYKVPLAIKNEVTAAYQNCSTEDPEYRYAVVRARHAIAMKEGLLTLEQVREKEAKIKKKLFPDQRKERQHGFSELQYKVLCYLYDQFHSQVTLGMSYQDLANRLQAWTKTTEHACQYLLERGYLETCEFGRVRMTQTGSKLTYGLQQKEKTGRLVLNG